MRSLFAVMIFAIGSATVTDAQTALHTIAHGSDSRMTAHRELVARTAGWWQFIWHEHCGSYEPPPIDFRREMVIAVFAGKAPSGTSIEITGVTQDAGTTTVYFHVREPANAAATEKSTISPFHMVVVPATRTPVTFVNITAS